MVNASSEENRLCINGMSDHKRDSKNANAAIVVSVGAEEFDVSDPRSAIAFQRSLEEKAYALGKGKIPQQLFMDYVRGVASTSYGAFASLHKGGTCFCDMSGLFSDPMRRAFLDGMELFGKKIKGFDREDAILSGVESRTSSPVRILRDDKYQSNISGIYPCGEGAGYAGGITSAAMDGLKVAEALIDQNLGEA